MSPETSPSPAPARARTLSPAQLEHLADHIEAMLDDLGWDQPPLGIVVSGDPEHEDDLEIAFRALDPGDPVADVVGLEAEPDWAAIGIVSLGTARRPTDEEARRLGAEDPAHAHEPAPGAVPLGRVRVLTLVGRDGRHSSVVRGTDGERLVKAASADPRGGRALDHLLRVFGLPTARPERDVRMHHAAWWLVSLLVAGEGGWRPVDDVATLQRQGLIGDHERLEWWATIRRQPLFADMLDEFAGLIAPAGFVPPPAELTALVTTFGNISARLHGWERMRRARAQGQGRVCVEPAVAAWLDDGSFSRLVMAGRPSESYALSHLTEVLGPQVHGHLTKVLAAWHEPVPPRHQDARIGSVHP